MTKRKARSRRHGPHFRTYPARIGWKIWLALVSALLASCAVAAFAAPPPGTDLNGWQHQWFEKQRSVSGTPCCGLGDGHFLTSDQWRPHGDHYEVLINGTWMKVAPSSMRDPVVGGPNPFGQAIVWYKTYPDGDTTIWCFSPGFEG